MIKYLIMTIFCATIVIFVSCEDINKFEENYEYGVFCFLSDIFPYQNVRITKKADFETLKNFAIGGDYEKWNDSLFVDKFAVKNAEVFIITNGDTTKFEFGINENSAYSETRMFNIKSLTLYKLLIKLPDGNIIQGSTRSPGEFQILEPDNNSAIRGEKIWINEREAIFKIEFKVKWEKSENAFGYLVKTNLDGSTMLVESNEIFLSYVRPIAIRKISVAVYAIDRNFYYFLRKEILRSGVSNAYGIFGSSTAKVINLDVVY